MVCNAPAWADVGDRLENLTFSKSLKWHSSQPAQFKLSTYGLYLTNSTSAMHSVLRMNEAELRNRSVEPVRAGQDEARGRKEPLHRRVRWNGSILDFVVAGSLNKLRTRSMQAWKPGQLVSNWLSVSGYRRSLLLLEWHS